MVQFDYYLNVLPSQYPGRTRSRPRGNEVLSHERHTGSL